MVHWPPQPCVEDEITSLEHEQISPKLVEDLKSDDDPAIERGTVDQYPILVDTDNEQKTKKSGNNNGSTTKRAPELSSSDDCPGPTTPPSPYQPQMRAGRRESRSKIASAAMPVAGAERSNENKYNTRGRPQVTRIDTALGADLHAMATGDRRAPSPYSYTRNSSKTEKADVQQVNILSPADQTTSPVPTSASSKHLQFSPNLSADARGVLSDEPDVTGRERRRYRSKSRARSRSHPREPSIRRGHRSSRTYATESESDEDQRGYRRSWSEANNPKPPTGRGSYTPPYSRRQSREASYGNNKGELPSRMSRYDGEEPRSQQSSHASSTDDMSKTVNARNERARGKDDERRLPSFGRKTRPQFDTFSDGVGSRPTAQSSVDDSAVTGKDSNRRAHLNLVTPLTADAASSMENVFERAFRDNEHRRLKSGHSYRGSGSALASPLTSPPRTPRSERQSREYFETDLTSQREAQRSRPPSIDEGTLSALKMHASLLSAATAGATMAARAASDQYHPSRTSNKPRSRRPSPVREERSDLARSSAMRQGEGFRSAQATSHGSEYRPSSRSSFHDIDLQQPFTPQRSASYSGYELPQSVSRSTTHAGPESSHAGMMPSTPYSPSTNTRWPMQQQSLHTSNAQRDLRLPSCPRPRLVAGYNDWTSIKELSDLDICPTCVSVLRQTWFSSQFIPSLKRPYNEPSVCAMSKPWFRIAILRAHRQGDADLNKLRALYARPASTRSCNGSRPDVRMWFNIIDPSTGEPIPHFTACAACVWAVDSIFPNLTRLLVRPKRAVEQEKVCSLRTDSKHFPTLINQFEQVAAQCGGKVWHPSNVQSLVSTIRRVCRNNECSRDKLLPTRTWHFMPDLPEFTVCEECYQEVVWPLNDRPIARDMSLTARVVPKRRNSNGNNGISCQLYSDRMRDLFRNVVASRNLALLCDAARTRQATQLRLLEMNKLFEADQKYGIDRRIEMDRNNAIWRTLE